MTDEQGVKKRSLFQFSRQLICGTDFEYIPYVITNTNTDMTENTKTAMIAINKWFYYAMNYNVVGMLVTDFKGERTEYLPDCFLAFPKYLRMHLKGKWDYAYETYGSRAVLMAFYAELDGTNRKLLMEWVLNNFNDEVKLNFKEED